VRGSLLFLGLDRLWLADGLFGAEVLPRARQALAG